MSAIDCAGIVLDRDAFERCGKAPFSDDDCVEHCYAAKEHVGSPALPDDFRSVSAGDGFGFLFRFDFFYVATWQRAASMFDDVARAT